MCKILDLNKEIRFDAIREEHRPFLEIESTEHAETGDDSDLSLSEFLNIPIEKGFGYRRQDITPLVDVIREATPDDYAHRIDLAMALFTQPQIYHGVNTMVERGLSELCGLSNLRNEPDLPGYSNTHSSLVLKTQVECKDEPRVWLHYFTRGTSLTDINREEDFSMSTSVSRGSKLGRYQVQISGYGSLALVSTGLDRSKQLYFVPGFPTTAVDDPRFAVCFTSNIGLQYSVQDGRSIVEYSIFGASAKPKLIPEYAAQFYSETERDNRKAALVQYLRQPQIYR